MDAFWCCRLILVVVHDRQVQGMMPHLQVKVDGQDAEEEDLRFEILPGRIRCAMPGAAYS